MESKICNKCSREQPVDQFKFDSRNKSGRQGICTSCHKNWQRKKREDRRNGIGVVPVSEKECNRCKKVKPSDKFYKDSACSDGLSTLCKECRNESMTKWRNENRAKYNANMREYRASDKDKFKDIDLRRTYGIGLDVYKTMYDAQGGVCAKCKKPQLGIRPLCVDHDPTTTKKTGIRVRALLCYKCNRDQHVIDNKDAWVQSVNYDTKYKVS